MSAQKHHMSLDNCAHSAFECQSRPSSSNVRKTMYQSKSVEFLGIGSKDSPNPGSVHPAARKGSIQEESQLIENAEQTPRTSRKSVTAVPNHIVNCWNDSLADFPLPPEEDYDEIFESSYVELMQTTSNKKELSYPHVPKTVEEVSLIRSLHQWTNHNVRLAGKMSPRIKGAGSNEWMLASIGEEGGPYVIAVDLSLTQSFPKEAQPIELYGELHLRLEAGMPSPYVKAKFFRNFGSVDLSCYKKAMNQLQHFIPHFINKN